MHYESLLQHIQNYSTGINKSFSGSLISIIILRTKKHLTFPLYQDIGKGLYVMMLTHLLKSCFTEQNKQRKL